MRTNPALNEYVMLKVLVARQTSARQLTQAGLSLDHPGEGGLFLLASVPEDVDLNLLVRGATFSADNQADAHIRFNVAFSQQPRLADYLRARLQSLAGARAALARVSGGAVNSKS